MCVPDMADDTIALPSFASQSVSLPCPSNSVQSVANLAVPPDIVLSPPLPATGLFARSGSFGIMIEQDTSSIFDTFADAEADDLDTSYQYNPHYPPAAVHLRHSAALRYGRKSFGNHFRRHTKRHGRRLDDLAPAPMLALNDEPMSEPAQIVSTPPSSLEPLPDAEKPPNQLGMTPSEVSGLGLSHTPAASGLNRESKYVLLIFNSRVLTPFQTIRAPFETPSC